MIWILHLLKLILLLILILIIIIYFILSFYLIISNESKNLFLCNHSFMNERNQIMYYYCYYSYSSMNESWFYFMIFHEYHKYWYGVFLIIMLISVNEWKRSVYSIKWFYMMVAYSLMNGYFFIEYSFYYVLLI